MGQVGAVEDAVLPLDEERARFGGVVGEIIEELATGGEVDAQAREAREQFVQPLELR